MLRLFSRQLFLIQLLLLIVVTAWFWIPAVIHPLPVRTTGSDGPLFSVLSDSLQASPMVTTILAMLIALAISVFLNLVLTLNDLLPRENLLPAMLMLIFQSWDHKMLCFNALSLALLFILYSLFILMKLYGQQEPYKLVFSASFGIGIAALIYFPSAYILLMVWFSFVTYRITTWREWMITFIGFLIPFLYLFSFYYISDHQDSLIHFIISQLTWPGLSFYGLKSKDFLWILTTLFVLIVSLLGTVNGIQDKLISQRKKTFILVNCVFSCIIVAVLSAAQVMESGRLVYIPLAAFMSLILNLTRKTWVLDILMTLYIAMLFGFSLT